jgi:hypothetical protein
MSLRPVIQWLEEDVKRWGFNPQDLTIETWLNLYDQHRNPNKIEIMSMIRKELVDAEAGQRIRSHIARNTGR